MKSLKAKSKILLVDDHEEFRRTLKQHLAQNGFPESICEASSGELGIVMALREKPDIILMDMGLPSMHGAETATQIKKYLPNCAIIILTMFETEAFKEAFKSRDIVAYVGKSELYEKLVPVMEKILEQNECAC